MRQQIEVRLAELRAELEHGRQAIEQAEQVAQQVGRRCDVLHGSITAYEEMLKLLDQGTGVSVGGT